MDERHISDLLREYKIPTHLMGFDYLKKAIVLAYNNIHYKNNITRLLYPDVATSFDASQAGVERAIRHAIARAGIKKTNGEFIFDCVEDLRSQAGKD